MLQTEEKAGSVFFYVRVRPRSSESVITGEHDGCVKVNLKAPPVSGQANIECCRFLAKVLGVSRSQVLIVSGLKGRLKRVKVEEMTEVEFTEKITHYL